jgi:hypothetical protein
MAAHTQRTYYHTFGAKNTLFRLDGWLMKSFKEKLEKSNQ